MDDGTDTLEAARLRHEPPVEQIAPSQRGRFNQWKTALRRERTEWVDHIPRAVTFFTTYNLDVAKQDALVRHEYTHLRASVHERSQEDLVIFLGQPLVSQGYMSEQCYIALLQAVARHLGAGPVLYVPHPRESDEEAERCGGAVGWTVRRLLGPIELELATRPHHPRALASFFCSALETCSILFAGQVPVKAFRIPDHAFTNQRTAAVRIYDYFQSKPPGSLEVVKL